MRALALMVAMILLCLTFGLLSSADLNTPVSVNVRDANAREVLDLIGTSANLDIKFDTVVHGTVTVSLNDVPAGTALRLIADTLGLEMFQEDGTVHFNKPAHVASNLNILKTAIADVPEPQLGYRVYIAPKQPKLSYNALGYGSSLYGAEENYVTEKIPVYFADAVDIAYIFGGDEIETRMSDYSGGGYGSGGNYGGSGRSNYGSNNYSSNNRSSRTSSSTSSHTSSTNLHTSSTSSHTTSTSHSGSMGSISW